ncbi:MAG: hypothetical protein ACRBK7_04945 [Acidimicrobiales bacterium]
MTTTLVFGFLTVRASAPAGAQFRLAGVDVLSVEVLGSPQAPPVIGGLTSSVDTIPVDRADPSTVPAEPATFYAGVRWSLLEARFVSMDESSDGFPVIIAELELANITDSLERRVRPSDLALIWSDGQQYELNRFDRVSGSSGFSLQPGEVRAVTAVFKPRVLEDPIFDEIALEVAEAGRIPARIPLNGPLPEQMFPIVGSIAADAAVVDDPDRPTGQLVVTPQRVALGLNAGPYRAAHGTRLVLVELSVQRAESNDDATFLQQEFWQLDIDGTSVAPSRVSRRSAAGPVGSSSSNSNRDHLTLVFVVAEDFGDVTLRVAPGSAATADYAIVFVDEVTTG